MSEDADPLQGVVTRRDCAHAEGSEVPSAPLPAGTPLAGLEEELMRRISEARTRVTVAQYFGHSDRIKRAIAVESALSDLGGWWFARKTASGVGSNDKMSH